MGRKAWGSTGFELGIARSSLHKQAHDVSETCALAIGAGNGCYCFPACPASCLPGSCQGGRPACMHVPTAPLPVPSSTLCSFPHLLLPPLNPPQLPPSSHAGASTRQLTTCRAGMSLLGSCRRQRGRARRPRSRLRSGGGSAGRWPAPRMQMQRIMGRWRQVPSLAGARPHACMACDVRSLVFFSLSPSPLPSPPRASFPFIYACFLLCCYPTCFLLLK